MQRPATLRAVWLLPIVVVAMYLVTLVVRLRTLLATTYLSADSASAPVIGELFDGRGPHSIVTLGHVPWFSTLLFELGTRWMPLHRQIWEGAPYLLALLSAALVAWGAWRVYGRWAGAMSLAIMVCAGPSMLALMLTLNDHAPTWFTLAVIGAFLVLVEDRAETVSAAMLGLLAVGVGVVVGANGASDSLVSLSGAAPLLLAVTATCSFYPSRRSARAAGFALVACVVGLLVGHGVALAMHHANVNAATDPRTSLLVGAESVGGNFKLWWESLAVLGNGNFFGLSVGFSAVLAFACAALTLGAVLIIPRICRSELGIALAARASQRRTTAREGARLAWVLYWTASAVLLSIAFIFSDAPEDLGSSRYLAGVIYAAAALVPLLGTGVVTRAIVTAGVVVYAFAGWLSLAQNRITPPASPNDQIINTIAQIARHEHLTVGYAGYWDAAPITWSTHMRLRVFPVDDCDGNQHLCGFELHLITSWYTPRPHTRTFLLSDTTYPAVPSSPTPDLGKPLAIHQIGPVTMYVYSYDIASKLFAL